MGTLAIKFGLFLNKFPYYFGIFLFFYFCFFFYFIFKTAIQTAYINCSGGIGSEQWETPIGKTR